MVSPVSSSPSACEGTGRDSSARPDSIKSSGRHYPRTLDAGWKGELLEGGMNLKGWGSLRMQAPQRKSPEGGLHSGDVFRL
jgi:hypothetical protein